MIFDYQAQLVVGNLGWVDKGALWIFDFKTRTENLIPVEGTKSLGLRAGANGLFRLVHHGSADEKVSIRSMREPGIALASIRVKNNRAIFSGDADLWRHVELAFIINTSTQRRLTLVDRWRYRLIDLDLSWFNNENYDLGYQGLVDCVSLPENDAVIVSIQRSSDLVVIDSERNERVGEIKLQGRYGNPRLQKISPSAFLASDYDTLCRVDSRSLAVTKTIRLQGAAVPYIGNS